MLMQRRHCTFVRRRQRSAAARVCRCLLAVIAALGLTPPLDTLAETDGVIVSVKTVSLDLVEGQLIKLSLEDGLLLEGAGAERQHIPMKDLVSLRTGVPVSIRPHQGYTLQFANGDVLHGDIAEGDGTSVVVETPTFGRLKVPLDSLAQMVAAVATRSSHRDTASWFVQKSALVEDAVLLTNGDVLQGFVDSVDAIGITIESGLGDTVVPHRLVVAMRLASPQLGSPSLPHVLATFQSGCRLTLTDLDWAGRATEARLWRTGGPRIQFAADQVVRIEFVGGRWEWLTAHHPISFEHTPMLSVGWEYAVDRNVLGGPIEVDGQRFDHGVGVHSRSRLIYDLQGTYREFVTSFGIDDDSGPHADVSVSIFVDGQRGLTQEHVRRGKLYGPVRIDTQRANRIELVVDFGENGYIQDRFNWVEAALIR